MVYPKQTKHLIEYMVTFKYTYKNDYQMKRDRKRKQHLKNLQKKRNRKIKQSRKDIRDVIIWQKHHTPIYMDHTTAKRISFVEMCPKDKKLKLHFPFLDKRRKTQN